MPAVAPSVKKTMPSRQKHWMTQTPARMMNFEMT